MFRAQTMKMAGGSLTPCIKKDLEDMIPRRIRRPVGKQTATCRHFVWGSDMPSAEGCDESVLQHADEVWQKCCFITFRSQGESIDTCIKHRPWGYDPPQNQAACGKANSHMQGLFVQSLGLSNNKDRDQHVHPLRLISAFVIRFLESIVSKFATGKFPRDWFEFHFVGNP